MQARKIKGHTAVRGLFGDGWVYLRSSKTGLNFLGLPSWVKEEHVRAALGDDETSPVRVASGVGHAQVEAEMAAEAMRAPGRCLKSVSAPQGDRLAAWRADYAAARDESAVREWADAAMRTYENRERAREEARKKLRDGQPDEDGFVTVVGGPTSLSIPQERLKRKSGVEPEGFYRWQKRQKADVDGLRERFAQDKKRVAAAARLHMPRAAVPEE